MKKYFILFFLPFLIVCSSPTGRGDRAPTSDKLTIGISQEFENMNGLVQQMSASRYVLWMVERPLVLLNHDWEQQCYLCKEVPSLENGLAKIVDIAGEKTLIVDWELRENARWGDGQPITGHDVKLSWEIGSSPNVSVGEKEIFTQIEKIEVDSQNPKKIRMTYAKSHYDFMRLGDLVIVPKHLEEKVWEKTKNETGLYEKQSLFTTDPSNPGLYSGPYVIKEIKLGSHISLIPNPYFYGEKPKFENIVIKLIPDTATLEANLLSGTIDVICELGMTFDQALALQKRIENDKNLEKKFKVLFRDSLVYEHIDLNLKNPIFEDRNVRQALIYGIDRAGLVKSLFENKQSRADQYFHPQDVYHSKDVPIYEYDPKKAADLLEASGWKKVGDGYRYKDGQRLSLVFMTTAQDKTRELVQVYLQEQWKKVGVEIKIKNEPARVFFGETIRKVKYPALAMFAWASEPDSPPRSTLHSNQRPMEENGYSGQNNAFWSDKEVDELLDQVYLEFDLKKRQALMRRLMQIYMTEVPTIPLYFRAEIAVIPAHLKNYRLTGHMRYSSIDVERWEKL